MGIFDRVFRRAKVAAPKKRHADTRHSWTIKGDKEKIRLARQQVASLQDRMGHETQAETILTIIGKAFSYYEEKDRAVSVCTDTCEIVPPQQANTIPLSPREMIGASFASLPPMPATSLESVDVIEGRISLCENTLRKMPDTFPRATRVAWQRCLDANLRIIALIKSGAPLAHADGTMGIKICDAHYYRPGAGTMKLMGSKKWVKASVNDVIDAARLCN